MLNSDNMKIKDNVKIAAFTTLVLGAAMPATVCIYSAICEYYEQTDMPKVIYDDREDIPDYRDPENRIIYV